MPIRSSQRLKPLLTSADLDGAKAYNETVNPELGVSSRPRTGNADAVRRTIAGNLDPKMSYIAELTAYDRSGGSCRLTLAGPRTLHEAPYEHRWQSEGHEFPVGTTVRIDGLHIRWL